PRWAFAVEAMSMLQFRAGPPVAVILVSLMDAFAAFELQREGNGADAESPTATQVIRLAKEQV
ncbi:MAG TPA: hypothetical protein VKG91_01670, partial [Roseiarcus sp.]|nr:hypothetical protein [Roseiarcus sp.]